MRVGKFVAFLASKCGMICNTAHGLIGDLQPFSRPYTPAQEARVAEMRSARKHLQTHYELTINPKNVKHETLRLAFRQNGVQRLLNTGTRT